MHSQQRSIINKVFVSGNTHRNTIQNSTEYLIKNLFPTNCAHGGSHINYCFSDKFRLTIIIMATFRETVATKELMILKHIIVTCTWYRAH